VESSENFYQNHLKCLHCARLETILPLQQNLKGKDMLETLAFLFKVVLFIAVLVIIKALLDYNQLRSLAESIREAWSNIGVAAKKQVSLINQLIDVVRSYQESEKLVMLKISEDNTNTSALTQLHQQAGTVLSTISGMAQRFPELKANEQYKRLIDSIQNCETQLEQARQTYNAHVKTYNSKRSSLPAVFYASAIGFRAAPYLNFEGNEITADVGALQSFAADDDGERINALIGKVGSSAARAGNKALQGGIQLATKAIEGGKALADSAQSKGQAQDLPHETQPAPESGTASANEHTDSSAQNTAAPKV